jgi:sigma-B regulation protein RsbU (phosphoserine phosphatase)
MPAGIVASSLQARIEAVAHHGRGNASSVVADINEALWNSTGAGRFATLVYAELDIERSRLTIVNAGHLPPIVLRPGGEPLLIGSTGPALGLTSQTTFDAVTVDFPPKALTLFYSDGVTESMDADDHEFDQSRLIDCLRSHQGEPAARICETILAAVRAHTGPKRAHDDLTVLAIRKRSSP